MNKQFIPKKVVIYGEDGDRIEIKLSSFTSMDFSYKSEISNFNKMDINIYDIMAHNMNYYVKRAGKRYKKNRRGYR